MNTTPFDDELVGNGHGLLRIAGVIADFEHELLAIDAASRVDVGNGLFGALLQLFAERGVLAGDRTSDADRRCQPAPWSPTVPRQSPAQCLTSVFLHSIVSLGIYDRTLSFRGFRTP